MAKTREDAIRQIAGLLKMAERKNGNEAEAAAAAARAQKLMDEFSLEMHQIDLSDKKGPKIAGKDVTGNHGRWAMMDWKIKLISWVADLNGCVAIRMGRRDVRLFGREEKLELVEYLTTYLCREVERLAIDVYWPQAAPYTDMIQRTWVQHFGIGCASRIAHRMKEERDREQQSANQVTALMVVDKQAVNDYIGTQLKVREAGKSKRKVTDAMATGYQAGEKVQWRQGLEKSDDPKGYIE